MGKLHLLAIIMVSICRPAAAQNVYFVDGYHGGIYGHYPVEWNTDFMVESMAEYPDWKICIEIEPETWDTVRVRTPPAYERFKALATDSRVEFTNPAYGQPYCYNISGESIIRQLDYGMRRINAHFPGVEFTTYSCEEPCFTSALPQILRSFGFRYAVLKCPDTMFGGYASPYGGELVNWIGPDGTSILTVPRYACESAQPGSTWQTIAWNNQTAYIDACRRQGIKHPVGMCFQDAGWNNGPWIGYGDKVRNNSIYVTWKEYIEQISTGKTGDDYRMGQEDIHVSLMWGSQVLQRVARHVRSAENSLSMAEKMGAIAALCNGYAYDPSRLDEAWRTLMLAQHHDAWIVPYNNRLPDRRGNWAEHVASWCGNVEDISGAITAEAMASFGAAGGGKIGGAAVRVFNTSGTSRREPVSVNLPEEYAGHKLTLRDAWGRETGAYTVSADSETRIEFMADVPAFGYATYRLEKKGNAPATDLHSPAGFTVENDMYRIVFDPPKGGTIKSLTAKKQGNREFAPGEGSLYSLGEIRGFFYEQQKFRSSADNPATVTITGNNAIRKTVVVRGTIDGHPFTQTITLVQGQERINFDLTIDWQGNPGIGEYRQSRDTWRTDNNRGFYNDRYKLSVLFPTSLRSPRLWKNAPFDVCESRLASTEYSDWDKIEHNVILNWVDLAESDGAGLALLSDHTTSYCLGEDFPLGLTVQYSGTGLFGRDYPITGATHINFALVPHGGTWDEAGIDRLSDLRNEPLTATFCPDAKAENHSLVDVQGTGYAISAANISGGGILLRVFNSAGGDAPQSIKLGFEAASVREVDLRGETIRQVRTTRRKGGDTIETRMPRFGFKTFVITTNS